MNTFTAGLLCLTLGAALAPVQGARDVLSIRNDTLTAVYDPASDALNLSSSAGSARLSGAKLRGSGGSAKVVAVTDPAFGAGQAIEIARPDGSVDRVSLYPNLPFVLLRSVLHNAGAEAVVANKVELLSTAVDLGKPAEALRAWGTGGLTAVDKHPGSYVYLALADPATRRGVVGAWLTFDRGSGVVFSSREGEAARLSARVEYGRLRLAPGASAETETFAIGLFEDARDGLEGWAEAVARHYAIHLHPQPSGYCTWYSDNHGGGGDEQSLAELTDFCARELKPFGFSVVQIDDGWQLGHSTNGPNKWFVGHRPDGPYRSGMKATADHITAAGLTPGIWFMPFAGNHDDPSFAAHQDWFVKRPDGQPYDTPWGGTSLDMTTAGARDHLREVVKACRDWGYKYFKMDGLYTGLGCHQTYVNDGYVDDHFGDAVFPDPDKTNAEAFRDGQKLVRETAGPDVFFLGCCIPQNMRSLGASIGLVDAMRIGPDNGTSWSHELEAAGTGRGLLSGPAAGTRRYFFNGRIWYNDPDPVYVRANMPLHHAAMIASWAGLTGQLTIDSDWLPSVPPERLELLKRIMPAHGLHARPVDLFEHDLPRVWVLADTRGAARRDVVGLFNWEAKAVEYDESFARLGLPEAAYVAYDFWGKRLLPLQKGALKFSVPAESCRILALRALSDRPQVISTSRHLTQGMIDLRDEAWDAGAGTLSGVSTVVGHDAYELRVLTVGTAGSWTAGEVTLSEADTAAGVTATMAQGNGLALITLNSAAGRDVHWSVKLRPRYTILPAPAAPTALKATADPFNKVDLAWQGEPGLSYEVARDGGAAVTAAGTAYHDADAAAGQSYTYTVTALNFVGRRSAGVALKVDVPAAPKLGPVPPKPDVSIMGLKALKATVGWGEVHAGKSVQGNALRLGHDTFADGMGVHAVSELVYVRRPEYRRFVAVAGIDEEEREENASSLDFRVSAEREDGSRVVLAASPVLRFGEIERWHFDVALPEDSKRVILECGDGGDGIRCDHGDWCDAGFLTLAGKADPGYDISGKLGGITTKTSDFGGFKCLDFTFEGRAAKIVMPHTPVEGHPWAWREEFWGHEPQTDLALLACGFHVVWCDTMGMLGGPPAMAIYDKFYDLLQAAGLAHKAALIGMSRGGLYAYNWAARRPDTVSCIYGDAPVLDARSWPGKIGASKSAGSPGDWQAYKASYGFKSDAEAIAFKGNPVDNLEPLAKAGIPIINVVGDVDTTVPVAENSNLVEERYPKLGGKIEVIHKPHGDHHPHSLPDPTPMVRFILAAMGVAE